MAIVLYDLAGRDDRRFSPNCWRARMAIAHKGLDCEARATRFTEIASIAGGGCKTIPVIEDGEAVVVDSWAIAEHLDVTYPDRLPLFEGSSAKALTRFVQNWVNSTLHAGVAGLIIADIHEHLVAEDQSYFRTSRERMFGKALEVVQSGREMRVEEFRKSLQPLRVTVQASPFLGGEGPSYGDYLAFAAFQWARTVSPFRLLMDDDPVKVWFERCLDLHGGLGRAALGYD